MGVEEDVCQLQDDLENVVKEMMKCKIDMYEKISDTNRSLEQQSIDRASNQAKLEENQSKLENKLDALVNNYLKLSDWFETHDKNEMEKIEKMTEAINKLSEILDKVVNDTDANSIALRKQKEHEMIARIKKEAIEEHNKPWKEYRNKAVGVVVTMVTGATALWIYNAIIALDALTKGGN